MRFLVYFLVNYRKQIMQSGMAYGAVRALNTSYSVAKNFIIKCEKHLDEGRIFYQEWCTFKK